MRADAVLAAQRQGGRVGDLCRVYAANADEAIQDVVVIIGALSS